MRETVRQKTLIETRQGAMAFAASPPCIFLLLTSLMAFGTYDPFAANLFADHLPVFLALMAVMSMALPVLAVLIRRCVHGFVGGCTSAGRTVLLMIPAIVLMWIPAVFISIPLYVWNLIRLARGAYPEGQAVRWRTALLIAAVLWGCAACSGMMERHRCSQPAATAEAAYRMYAPEAVILAAIPQGEDAVLIVSGSGCGVIARTEDGWRLQTPYRTTVIPLEGAAPASAIVCQNPAEGEDVVIVAYMCPEGEAYFPCDSAGSVFSLSMEKMEFASVTSCTGYAIVDADASGYRLWFE